MAYIRYVCLSDTHFGEEDSLLTRVNDDRTVDTSAPSSVLEALAGCLRALLRDNPPGSPVTLILNGDILELALQEVHEAILVFGHFISLVMPPGRELFDEIIYLPGNHDHHLWETSRETQYLNYIRDKLKPDQPLQPPWHTTKVFMDMRGEDRLVNHTLTVAAHRFGGLAPGAPEILTAYPNYGVLRTGPAGARAAVFHHGHFIEAIYSAMSAAASYVLPGYQWPLDIYTLEKENFAWIDFFWSTMGRSVPGVEQIYESTEDPRKLRALTDHLSNSIARRRPVPQRWLEGPLLKKMLRKHVVNRLAGQQERQQVGGAAAGPPLTPESRTGLESYLQRYLRTQMETEAGLVPETLTFVFGHTHKPFEDALTVGSLGTLPVFNSGGWIVESAEAVPVRGGAVILIDDDLNAVSLRIYNEGDYMARVEEPRRPGEEHTDLYKAVKHNLDTYQAPWIQLKQCVEEEVDKRYRLRAAAHI